MRFHILNQHRSRTVYCTDVTNMPLKKKKRTLTHDWRFRDATTDSELRVRGHWLYNISYTKHVVSGPLTYTKTGWCRNNTFFNYLKVVLVSECFTGLKKIWNYFKVWRERRSGGAFLFWKMAQRYNKYQADLANVTLVSFGQMLISANRHCSLFEKEYQNKS